MRPNFIALVTCTAAFLSVGTGCNKLLNRGGDDAGSGASAASGSPTEEKKQGILSSILASDEKPFEGEIQLAIKGKELGHAPTSLTYQVKGGKMRIELPSDAAAGPMGKGGYALLDSKSKKVTVVMDKEKRAMVMDLAQMGEMAKGLSGVGGVKPGVDITKPPPKITKTGKTDKVAGYDCDIWQLKDAERTVDLCVAKGIRWFDMAQMGGGKAGLFGNWLAELTDTNHFPLRVVVTAPSGEIQRMEATKIEAKKFDDAHFEVPAGYQVMDMNDMLKSLAGMASALPSGFPIPTPHLNTNKH